MAMEGGVGDRSYLRNSNGQAIAFSTLAPAIREAIQQNFQVFAQAKLVSIVDIGCSSGTNTINAVESVIKEVVNGLNDSKTTSFVVSFSDLKSNDFNTLFNILAGNHSQGKPYFYRAVPGSFAETLFPSSSVHFAMSNFALHILSKIPPVKNTGRVLVDELSSAETIATFAQQSHEDLCSFLKCRGEELVPGGILSCFFLGRTSLHEPLSPWFDYFQAAWEDLVKEGLISQECLDSFNLGVYKRSVDEVKQAVEESGPNFKTVQVKITPIIPPDSGPARNTGMLAKGFQAVTKPAVSEHFKGDANLVDLIYKKIEEKIEITPIQAKPFSTITLILVRV